MTQYKLVLFSHQLCMSKGHCLSHSYICKFCTKLEKNGCKHIISQQIQIQKLCTKVRMVSIRVIKGLSWMVWYFQFFCWQAKMHRLVNGDKTPSKIEC